MQLIRRNIHMDCLKCKASTQITLEDDVNISDSRPDAYKLIMDKGNVVIEEVKVSDDHVNVKGKLCFQVLYLTEEEKSDMAGMEGAIPFEDQIYMEGVRSGDSVVVEWDIEDLTMGLINSRKLSVQALVMVCASCEELCDEEVAIDLEADEPMEYRKKTLDIAAMVMRKKDIFRVKEEVEIPGSFPNILSMVWWDVKPVNVEFKMLADKISVQGEMKVFFLYRGEGEEEKICHYETTLPFSGSIDCMGAEEGMIPEIRYRAEVREALVQSDFDGEERVITFELCLNLDICAYEEEQLCLLSDVYGVVKEVMVSEREANFRKLFTKCSGKTKLSEHFKTDDGSQIMRIIHASGKMQITEETIVDNGIEICGVVNIHVLYENMSGDGYGMLKESIPFNYVLDAEGIAADCSYVLHGDVEQMAVSVIDSDEIDLKCVLFFKTHVYQKWKEKIVEQITTTELDGDKMAGLPGIAVYMVRDGESLWDIGKRYYVPIESLMQMNNMTSDEVKTGDRILIVKNV